ncbi:DeoR family transcriptional regulator [Candidatus Woesearchaeota archaeon]|nr:DeoR family transcriptional regulator [Candidatus Woesearchaeota archaeon]
MAEVLGSSLWLVGGALAAGAVLRVLFGIYKAFADKQAIRLDWFRILIELIAALVFGGASIIVMYSLGWIKPVATTIVALVGGFGGPDLVNTLAKHLGTKFIAPKVTKELPSTLSPRLQKAIDYVASTGSITNDQYQKLTGVSHRTAVRDLEELVKKDLLVREGTKRGARYKAA